jgi:hypothetical protein
MERAGGSIPVIILLLGYGLSRRHGSTFSASALEFEAARANAKQIPRRAFGPTRNDKI